MSKARLSRDPKRQLGQFLTPADTAAAIVGNLHLAPTARVLEPSFGEGAFLFPLLEAVAAMLPRDELAAWCAEHLYGCELDAGAYERFGQAWKARGLGPVPATLEQGDFFTWMPPGVDRRAATDRRLYFSADLEFFDLVIGNPPFGG